MQRNFRVNMGYCYKIVRSPVGNLTLIGSKKGLVAILWGKDERAGVKLAPLTEDKRSPILVQTEKELKEYFLGKRKKFTVKLDFIGTDFQKKVWRALTTIPYGQTRSYREVATQIRKPIATRAVGAAIGRNQIPIIVPCHRVIGTNGKLTGFAWGLEAKVSLLGIESKKKYLA